MDSDSDSSAGETASFTTTNVLLGYASKEPTDDVVNQLGGEPSFLDPASPPSAALARCMVCNSLMPQLLQLRGDMLEHFPGHERRLHVWACRRKPCKRKPGSVRALRSSRAAEVTPAPAKEAKTEPAAKPAPAPKPNLGTSIFGGGALFGAPPAAAAAAAAPKAQPADDLPTTFAAKARLAGPDAPLEPAAAHEPWPPAADLPAPYPSYFLEADFEELDREGAQPEPTALPDFADPTLTAAGSSKVGAKDDFESASDKTFQKFADRLAQNPEQVLRYEFGAAPLLYSRDDAIGKALGAKDLKASSTKGTPGVPRCARCGANRAFEVQLVPHAISELEIEDDGLDGMEWGTVIVAVCTRDCAGEKGEVVHVEEWAGVQWEEQGAKT